MYPKFMLLWPEDLEILKFSNQVLMLLPGGSFVRVKKKFLEKIG